MLGNFKLKDWGVKHITEPITAIWDFTAGLKALKIGIGQAPGTELLEIAKNTAVSAIVGMAKIGYDGSNSDHAIFSHINHATQTARALVQSSSGDVSLNCGSGRTVNLLAGAMQIAFYNGNGLTMNARPIYAHSVFSNYVSDTDSDTNDVLSTGITAKFGLVLIKETTGNKFCLFRIKGDNSIPIIIDGDAEFTVTKDTASSYNFYYETDQFKLQNKVGDNKALYVGLYLV